MTWTPVTCQESEALIIEHGGLINLTVLAGRTDLGGEHGDPIIITEWGLRDRETPVLRNIRHPAPIGATDQPRQPDRKPCEHYRWDPES